MDSNSLKLSSLSPSAVRMLLTMSTLVDVSSLRVSMNTSSCQIDFFESLIDFPETLAFISNSCLLILTCSVISFSYCSICNNINSSYLGCPSVLSLLTLEGGPETKRQEPTSSK
ncbi:unnamed protein product [Ambrosiozyma monospora]|uniref:Unnamed protein product n=1 Tax=Ambrosiozyma monospora TaxID=43982 RepID=A0ACB5TAN1_AMBMO|nr:unnamed protein product [Ambrosiozyma monospora]